MKKAMMLLLVAITMSTAATAQQNFLMRSANWLTKNMKFSYTVTSAGDTLYTAQAVGLWKANKIQKEFKQAELCGDAAAATVTVNFVFVAGSKIKAKIDKVATYAKLE